MFNYLRNTRVVTLIALALWPLACSNPAVEKQRHFERGNQYAAEKRDEFAVIEYANAVRIDPKFGEARLKLAETYERMQNARAAFAELIRAADALPDNRDVQLKATRLLLFGGRFEDAKARAAALLNKNPQDVDALLLLASAMTALKDPEGAIAEIDEAMKLLPNDSRALVNLGAVRMHSGDAKEAEAAFRKAVSLDPSSADPHLAFANFLWSAGRPGEAEAEIKQALALQPRNLLGNHMLGTILMATNRWQEAEQPLKVIAEASGTPAARLRLAEYYVRVRRRDDASKLLAQLAGEQATFSAAEAMLAALDYDAGRLAEAHNRLDNLLGRLPKDVRALVMKAHWLRNEKKLDEALQRAKAAVEADSQSVQAQFALATVHDQRHERQDAIKAYSETLRLNPRAAAAQLALSRLSLVTGDSDAAVHHAEEARQIQPANPAARLALARSLVARAELGRAQTEIEALLRDQPNSAAVHALNGSFEAMRNNPVIARASFNRALELMPDNFEALGGLVGLELRAKQFDAAVQRVDAALTKHPNRSDVLALAAEAYFQAGQSERAEQALKRAVSANPQFSAGYQMLAILYVKERRLDEARAEYEGMVKRDPKAVGPRTMVGMILQAQGKRDEARRWYEATVAEMTNAPVVANNLAYMYAEDGINLDIALQLATSAKQQLPNMPEIDDTLGWVYYKKDLPSMAVGPLEESHKKKPDSPNILYHLGLTYAKLGDKAKATDALERALKLNPQFKGAQTARETLASLSR